MLRLIFYFLPFALYIFTVWFSYFCAKEDVKDNEKIDNLCWIMIFMPFGNIGWAIGALISNQLENDN